MLGQEIYKNKTNYNYHHTYHLGKMFSEINTHIISIFYKIIVHDKKCALLFF